MAVIPRGWVEVLRGKATSIHRLHGVDAPERVELGEPLEVFPGDEMVFARRRACDRTYVGVWVNGALRRKVRVR